WTLIIWLGTLVKWIYSMVAGEGDRFHWLSRSWDIFQTFVFITFTRLFFRSGSNLDPALANEQAWNTAKNMVNQIGSAWDLQLIPAMAREHAAVLIAFVIGMIIHWLPEHFKRRYRIVFAKLPLGWMAVAVVLIILFIYQFITADLQSFIYFQF
ncbi:MAG: MBOAT family protein, partial [Bacteroidales bacterium]|nr:MBOAT family protein [Bacteroidales bacterium]